MKQLKATQMDRCIGCASCTLACARLVHGLLSWQAAGIRIASSGGLSTGFVARLCLACDPAPCAAICPVGALVQRRDGGIIYKSKRCIGCGQCGPVCPVGAIYLDSDDRPFVCIQCGQCVDYCPHQCLEMIEAPAATGGQDAS